MKGRRLLNRLALLCALGLALLAAGQENTATAAACPRGAPTCTQRSQCIPFCQALTGFPDGHFCHTATHCCVCAL